MAGASRGREFRPSARRAVLQPNRTKNNQTIAVVMCLLCMAWRVTFLTGKIRGGRDSPASQSGRRPCRSCNLPGAAPVVRSATDGAPLLPAVPYVRPITRERTMEELLRNVRYTLRSLRRSPGFAVVAVLTLAIGIGVNATMFSLVSAVLLRPLPVERPAELVNVYGRSADVPGHDAISYPNYLDYRARSGTLSGLVAHTNFFASLSVDGSTELVVGETVSDNFFDVLGVRPAIGRSFVAEEFTAPGAGPVAILGHSFWQGRFGGDPGILGRSLRLDGVTYTVVGVAPASFGGMLPAVSVQLWVPLSMVDEVSPLGSHRNTGGPAAASLLDSRGRHFLWLKGRMKPGVEATQVATEFAAIAARLAAEHPESNERERVAVLRTSGVAVNPDLDGTLAPAALVLLTAVGLVLLVTCANLASMMLARATARRREMAVRAAIGASRGRLVSQHLTESVTIALAGGAVAMLVAYSLTGLVARFQPPLPISLGLDIAPDWRVLLFTFLTAAATGIAFGLVPALRASRPDLVSGLKDVSRSDDGRGRRIQLRDALVVGQVAFSLLLLVVGAMMARSLGAAAAVDMGYDASRTAYVGISMKMNGYDAAEGGALVEAGKRRLQALPDVRAVGLATRVPQSLNNNGFGIFIDGHPATVADRPIVLDGASVDEDYFAALDVQVVAGRGIEFADREQRRRVAVITETAARRFWPGEDPLGREFRTARGGEPYRVVGVVQDYKVDTPGEAPKPYLHLPLPLQPLFASYMVRTATPAAPLLPGLERELRMLDPDLVFLESGTLRDAMDVRIFPVRAGAWFIGASGVLALLLAAIGLYGVIAFSVSRRVREIGIRRALGAETPAVVAMVVRRGMILVGVGGIIGAALAAAGAHAIAGVLFVGAFDPVSFALAFAALATVAALAHWVPAWRAARVDPMIALRDGQ
jgi:predicted permease